MREVTPVLVGFEISGKLRTEVLALNKDLLSKEINFKCHIPHLTLWMGFIYKNQLNSLNLGLRKIFSDIEIEVELNRTEIFPGILGNVLSVSIKENRQLKLLQNRIHHFFEPFRVVVEEFDGLGSPTVNYINKFPIKSLSAYEPHLTIGRSDLRKDLRIKHSKLEVLKMMELGNGAVAISVIE